MNGSDFTDNSFERECSEAARRVLEMDRKYKMQSGKITAENPIAKKSENAEIMNKPSPQNSGNDRMLLLGIFLLLLTEGAEPPLLLALLYILL